MDEIEETEGKKQEDLEELHSIKSSSNFGLGYEYVHLEMSNRELDKEIRTLIERKKENKRAQNMIKEELVLRLVEKECAFLNVGGDSILIEKDKITVIKELSS